jgi:hypothetical protein
MLLEMHIFYLGHLDSDIRELCLKPTLAQKVYFMLYPMFEKT